MLAQSLPHPNIFYVPRTGVRVVNSKEMSKTNPLMVAINELIPDAHVEITDAGCVISTHCGKGTIGILYVMK